jgi:hypothetical protein
VVAFSSQGDRIALTQIEQMINGTYFKLGYYDTQADNLTWFNMEQWSGGKVSLSYSLEHDDILLIFFLLLFFLGATRSYNCETCTENCIITLICLYEFNILLWNYCSVSLNCVQYMAQT